MRFFNNRAIQWCTHAFAITTVAACAVWVVSLLGYDTGTRRIGACVLRLWSGGIVLGYDSTPEQLGWVVLLLEMSSRVRAWMPHLQWLSAYKGTSVYVFVPLWLPMLAGVVMTFIMRRLEQRRRRSFGACPACGYSLHGLTSSRCPECGLPALPVQKPSCSKAKPNGNEASNGETERRE